MASLLMDSMVAEIDRWGWGCVWVLMRLVVGCRMKEVSVDGGKVLLSRVNGTYYATNASCSHYAAPLAKGVLSGSTLSTCFVI
jgi:hypothetical protein